MLYTICSPRVAGFRWLATDNRRAFSVFCHDDHAGPRRCMAIGPHARWCLELAVCAIGTGAGFTRMLDADKQGMIEGAKMQTGYFATGRPAQKLAQKAALFTFDRNRENSIIHPKSGRLAVGRDP